MRSAGEASLSLREREQYARALAALIPLSGPTKAFFDKVMVNVDDASGSRATASRCSSTRARYMNQVADLTCMSRGRAMKLIILDRDGTINEDRDDFVKSPDEWVPIPGSLEAIARLNHAGWHTVVATNQSGLARGLFDMATLNAIHAKMNRALDRARRPHRRRLLLPARPRRRLQLPQALARPASR